MTDNEIIKPLEWCGCAECMAILDLINRQKAEIERLEKSLTEQFDSYESIRKKAKAEAIKEFADRLKEPFEFYSDAEEADALYIVGLIDSLVEEMTEGKTDGQS